MATVNFGNQPYSLLYRIVIAASISYRKLANM